MHRLPQCAVADLHDLRIAATWSVNRCNMVRGSLQQIRCERLPYGSPHAHFPRQVRHDERRSLYALERLSAIVDEQPLSLSSRAADTPLSPQLGAPLRRCGKLPGPRSRSTRPRAYCGTRMPCVPPRPPPPGADDFPRRRPSASCSHRVRACVRAYVCTCACACVRSCVRSHTRARGACGACVPACRSDGGTTDSRCRRWRAQLAPHTAERLSACLRLGGASAAGAAGGGASASASPVAAGSYLGALAAVMLWLVLGSPGGLPAGCTRDYHGSGLTPLQSHSVRNLAKFWRAVTTTLPPAHRGCTCSAACERALQRW